MIVAQLKQLGYLVCGVRQGDRDRRHIDVARQEQGSPWAEFRRISLMAILLIWILSLRLRQTPRCSPSPSAGDLRDEERLSGWHC